MATFKKHYWVSISFHENNHLEKKVSPKRSRKSLSCWKDYTYDYQEKGIPQRRYKTRCVFSIAYADEVKKKENLTLFTIGNHEFASVLCDK